MTHGTITPSTIRTAITLPSSLSVAAPLPGRRVGRGGWGPAIVAGPHATECSWLLGSCQRRSTTLSRAARRHGTAERGAHANDAAAGPIGALPVQAERLTALPAPRAGQQAAAERVLNALRLQVRLADALFELPEAEALSAVVGRGAVRRRAAAARLCAGAPGCLGLTHAHIRQHRGECAGADVLESVAARDRGRQSLRHLVEVVAHGEPAGDETLLVQDVAHGAAGYPVRPAGGPAVLEHHLAVGSEPLDELLVLLGLPCRYQQQCRAPVAAVQRQGGQSRRELSGELAPRAHEDHEHPLPDKVSERHRLAVEVGQLEDRRLRSHAHLGRSTRRQLVVYLVLYSLQPGEDPAALEQDLVAEIAPKQNGQPGQRQANHEPAHETPRPAEAAPAASRASASRAPPATTLEAMSPSSSIT